MEKRNHSEIKDTTWKEKVLIETAEYIIKGFVFMPNIGKRSRLLSDMLNSNKQFLAVKECTVESKLMPQKELEKYDFIQVNISTILLMRPLDEN